ncbi:MAG TPA: phenylacetate--CoA ligase [Candidatus Aphodovivens avistercoris]|nr:phenylacetate--CoA ligase [Candidatus Aphodovivens avistercoris]
MTQPSCSGEARIDVGVKGAALAAAAAGRFGALPIYDRAIECASRERIRAIQLEKLIAQVEWTYARVPWYREKMDAMGVSPADIKTLDDVRKLPFTDKTALRDTFPYGLFAVPLDEVVELHASSGTTGKPIVVGYNDHDMDVWSDCIARLSQMAGVVPGDRVQMAFGYGMFTGGFGLHYGLQKLGCMMIPAGSGNTERHIAMIEDYGTTVLVATPTYALHICEVGEKLGYDWEKSQLRVGLFGGEPCPPGLKAEIESRMHIVCTDNYGLTEVMGPGVAGECLAARDMQHIAEDHFLWEVVDPETGEPVGEGEMGELVLTPLDKQAIPVLRYRTHDLTRVVTEPCSCGRTHARMQKVRSRSDDMLIIRGTNVFPSQVEDVLAGIEGITPHYRIIVEEVGGLDRMTVQTEIKPEAFSDSFEQMDAFRASVAEKLKGTLLVGVRVQLVEPGGIERTTGKAKHVEDRRKA